MNIPSELKTHAPSVAFSQSNHASKTKPLSLTRHRTESGINALLDCSADVFEYFHRITQYPITSEIKQSLTQFLETLQQRYQLLGYSQDTALAAHYAICATLDDILHQHAKHSLQNTELQNDNVVFLQNFHQSRLESEKFYSILEHISSQPEKYIDLLELMYLCMRFGYKGQYRHTPFGLQQWTLLTDSTYRLITTTRGQPSHLLSPHLIKDPVVLSLTAPMIVKKRRRFYVLTSLTLVFCALVVSYVFRQAYDATQNSVITPSVKTSPQEIAS